MLLIDQVLGEFDGIINAALADAKFFINKRWIEDEEIVFTFWGGAIFLDQSHRLFYQSACQFFRITDGR